MVSHVVKLRVCLDKHHQEYLAPFLPNIPNTNEPLWSHAVHNRSNTIAERKEGIKQENEQIVLGHSIFLIQLIAQS